MNIIINRQPTDEEILGVIDYYGAYTDRIADNLRGTSMWPRYQWIGRHGFVMRATTEWTLRRLKAMEQRGLVKHRRPGVVGGRQYYWEVVGDA